MGTPIGSRGADDRAISEVVEQGITLALVRLPPYRNLRVDEIVRDGLAASTRVRLELWDEASQSWVASAVRVDLAFVAGGWRLREIGSVGPNSEVTTTLDVTTMPEAPSETATVVLVETATSPVSESQASGFTITAGAPIHVQGVGVVLPVTVTNRGDASVVTLAAELDVLIRDPSATGWWTLAGTVALAVPAGATLEVNIDLVDVPYASGDEWAAVAAALRAVPPVDVAVPQVRVAVDGPPTVSAATPTT